MTHGNHGFSGVSQPYETPTEDQWEYAAHAGTAGARYGELDAIAWHGGNSGIQTHPVKQKTANAWGLHEHDGECVGVVFGLKWALSDWECD